MVIDFCHHEDHDEYEHILEYYKENFKDGSWKIKPIFRYICTHPHHDHICWLHKLLDDTDIEIYNYRGIDHDFKPESFDWHARHEDDRKSYEKMKKWEYWERVFSFTRDSTPWDFWSDDEDRITILSPSKKMIESVHKNNEGEDIEAHKIDIDHISYALMIEVNDAKIILWWDGRLDVWESIKEEFQDAIKDVSIFKAPHHGHFSAFERKEWEESEFVHEIVEYLNPEYIVFSNSSQEDKDHGAEDEYKKACPNSKILKTCNDGNIVLDCGFDWKINVL